MTKINLKEFTSEEVANIKTSDYLSSLSRQGHIEEHIIKKLQRKGYETVEDVLINRVRGYNFWLGGKSQKKLFSLIDKMLEREDIKTYIEKRIPEVEAEEKAAREADIKKAVEKSKKPPEPQDLDLILVLRGLQELGRLSSDLNNDSDSLPAGFKRNPKGSILIPSKY